MGEIPLELQGKLLRVLQEQQFERVGENRTRSVDVRVIAATNRDLKTEARARTFREDLYFRLNVFPIESVPLRYRVDDIPLLAQEFLTRTCQKFNRPPIALTEADVEALQAYSWPGNVRELENAIERQVITFSGRLQFDQAHQAEPTPERPARHVADRILTEEEVRLLERQNLSRALKASAGRVFGDDGAARLLGLKPTTLASRLRKQGLDPQAFRIREPD